MPTTTDKLQFEPSLKRAVNCANSVARARKWPTTEPLDLLAGLLYTERGTAYKVLDDAGVSYNLIKGHYPRGEQQLGDIRPLSDTSMEALDQADQLAKDLGGTQVLTEHLAVILLYVPSVRNGLQRWSNTDPDRVQRDLYTGMFFDEIRAAAPHLGEAVRHVQAAQTLLARWQPSTDQISVDNILILTSTAHAGVENLL